MHNSSPDPIHTLNSLPSAQVSELAACTPLVYREAGFGFAKLPNRMDGGMDNEWGSALHRADVAFHTWSVDHARRRNAGLRQMTPRGPRRVSSAVFVQRPPVNGAMRGLVFGLLMELAAVAVIAAFVIARRLY